VKFPLFEGLKFGAISTGYRQVASLYHWSICWLLLYRMFHDLWTLLQEVIS